MVAIGNQLVVNSEHFQQLFDVLSRRGYQMLGPTVRNKAIVYEQVSSVSDLPIGYVDEQDGGVYRLKKRGAGGLREKVYRPLMGELRAHQISTALASAAFFSWAFFMLRKQVTHLDKRRLLLIGGDWVSLTMLFEFGFGHYVAKTPWKRLFHDYNLLRGRVWPLFLLTELMSPLLIKFVKNAC